MAGSQSFAKRENEKKKQAKRLEKQRSKEARRAGGTSSFDEMIAWVDADGSLTSVPPEERERTRQEVKLEDIAVSTPKKVEEEETPMRGRVEYFNASKGYGFIKDLDSTEKYFFHVTVAPEGIAEGRLVTFFTERTPRGMQAVSIAYADQQ